jgi:hypothetical protein
MYEIIVRFAVSIIQYITNFKGAVAIRKPQTLNEVIISHKNYNLLAMLASLLKMRMMVRLWNLKEKIGPSGI